MATGLLVVLVGEGTKLSRWVMGCDMTYLARIALGSETDTLDAQGEAVAEAPVLTALTREHQGRVPRSPRAGGATAAGVPRHQEGGKTLMERARAGEVPEVHHDRLL